MKCELEARAIRALISRVLVTFVGMLVAVTFAHAWVNDTVVALLVSLGLGFGIVMTAFGRFPE